MFQVLSELCLYLLLMLEFPTSFYNMWFRSVAGRTDKVIKAADVATSFRQECQELKNEVQELKSLLDHCERIRDTLFDHPLNCIIIDTEKVLHKAARLIVRCCGFRLCSLTQTLLLSRKCQRNSNSVLWMSLGSYAMRISRAHPPWRLMSQLYVTFGS